MLYCSKCGRELEIEAAYCPECEKKLENEVLRIKGVTKHIADTIPEKIPEQPNAEGKWSQHRFSLKNVVLLVLIIVFLGIAIVLLYMFYNGLSR
jgi:uncharacterized membrane protein YvbJ